MSTSREQIEAALRQSFRYLNRFMLLNWRLGLGPTLSLFPPITGRYLVLTHTGRKSGQPRRTPLNYAADGGVVYVTAGFGAVSDWYRNILANPHVELWMPGERFAARAVEVPRDDPRWLDLLRLVLKGSGFASFMAGINPYTLSDADLDRLTADYRVIAIDPRERLSGPGGPGDLAWVWLPLAGAGLGVALARLRRRPHRT